MADKIDSLVEEVGKLTTATTDLINTVNTSKVELDTAVTSATNQATSATNQATVATQQATKATQQATVADTSAAQAKSAAANAVAVTTGGTASLTAAAGKIPIANSKGEIDKNYLNIFIRDSYRHSVEAATGGKNTVLYDKQGNANVMVVIPKFTYDDIGMTDTMGTGTVTAFTQGGKELPEIFIGKYLGSGDNGVSAADVDPKINVDFDQAKSICEGKGAGWHLMTVHEWAAIALWCIANGYQPRGNSQYGRSHENHFELGRRGDGKATNDRTGSARTNTGTGPAAWAHDKTVAGVCDLVGNVWEWQLGLKTQDGRVICTPDNDFTLPEASWVAQDCYFDSPFVGDENDRGSKGAQFINSQVTNYSGPKGDSGNYASTSQTWNAITKDPSYTSSELMKRLLIEPAAQNIQGLMYIRNYGERLPFRGGNWYGGPTTGLAALRLYDTRSAAHSSIGFRPAYHTQ